MDEVNDRPRDADRTVFWYNEVAEALVAKTAPTATIAEKNRMV